MLAACEWLDNRLDWSPGTSARHVTSRLAETKQQLPPRRARRARITRADVTNALKAYYGNDSDYPTYTATIGTSTVATTILSRPEWQDLTTPLTAGTEHITLSGETSRPLREFAPEAALDRLAEVEVAGIRLTNDPVYRLLNADRHVDGIHARVDAVDFLEYALTMDLLENELLDALAEKRTITPGALPLRDNYLPTTESVVDLPSRICAGGIVAVTAIARDDPVRGHDYALLMQERSSSVVNAAHQLTVIPKGFHQPLINNEADVSIRASLLREIEEELFGRADIDGTLGASRAASPMHPSRMSAPMQWLLAHPDTFRLELTGFGLNLVSGNYEFACLVAIDDPTFWHEFGGHIEANWETRRINTISNHDTHALDRLLAENHWNNEGLFALASSLGDVLPHS